MKFLIPFLFIAVSSIVPPIGAAELPNIVLMMSDDQGWGETSYNGHPNLKTPVLDEMATNGLRLDRFYAASPVCSPTRASVLTGRHANRMGAFGANWSIRPEEITLAPLLKAAGYRTAHYGKWHVGAVKKDSPLSPKALGFDESLSHDNFFEMNPALSRNGNPPAKVNGEGSEILVKEALDFVRRSANEDAPFFLVIWFGSPHSPYECSAEDSEPYRELGGDLSRRYGEIAAMDRAIGQFRDGLDLIDERANTLLWFNSDNGMTTEMIPKTQQANMFNGGLRGTKSHMTEGGLRVPAIIEWPAVITEARSSSVPCVTSDILPTLLDIVQITHPKPERPLDGISLKSLFVDGTMNERIKPIGFSAYDWKAEQENEPWLEDQSLNEFITETAKKKPTQSKRKTYFKNHRHPVAGTEFEKTRVWIDNRYKLLFPKSRDARYELYDIVADKEESHDIALKHPEIVERMAAELKAWQLSVERSLTGADYGNRTGATGQKAAPVVSKSPSNPRKIRQPQSEPVEESINTHMSLLFKPSYRRLKLLMREGPEDAAGWKAIQAEALLLAESGGNLTTRRASEVSILDGKEYWAKNSSEVRTFGAELYRSAKEKDFAAATRSYKSMTTSCNACHRAHVFLGDPPVLTPFGKGLTD